ncbi:hypothetical protein KNU78_gp18 [Gordonia phage Sukkupi]|uniref:Uncharacterized protein n=1 Tax=Gordonia phage Sukkupi TaxID=2653747 RepID=A0A5Q2WNR2_9CAUD|nr:hypothetical protein KNU78_gp18 [Gordonia phage Sukkupi]QAU07067.1 hypothetical protein SEA_BIPAUNETO_19 [Gordonia phage BiPauneto]QGH79261.1 hypothetical protein SEA_SUKKUPI_18 [Gordonia phage Sukkupi]QGH80734.1 hypothetical protein SEA_YNDEXA_18 [Gordonia phage Yndexa]
MSERAEEVRVSVAEILASVGMAQVVLSVEEMKMVRDLLRQAETESLLGWPKPDQAETIARVADRIDNLIERMEE